MLGTLVKLLVKDKLLRSGKVPEHGAETPEEKETRNGSSAILHIERGEFYTGLPHIYYFPIHLLILVLSFPKRDWIQRYLKSTM